MTCDLLRGIACTVDSNLTQVSPGACEACCSKFEPSVDQWNPVIASLLHALTDKVIAAEGVEGLDVAGALALRARAEKSLDVLPGKCSDPEVDNPMVDSPCFYLGDQVGEKPCRTCKGNVRLKAFACRHPLHEETTYHDCRSCDDYDAPLEVGAVRSWEVGVTTAPRENWTLLRSLESLRRAGWEDFCVYADHGVSDEQLEGVARIVQRQLCE